MPRFVVNVSAELQNIESIKTPEDYPWYVSFVCGNCGERPPKPIVLRSSETVEGIRGASVNLRMTCKFCDRANDVAILSEDMEYTSSNAPEWGPLLKIECRGIEPIDVTLADDVPLEIIGTDGFVFEDAFIQDGEYFGWDEKNKVEASITEFRLKVDKV